MRRPSRRLLGRIADVTIPWGVGLFLVLVVLEEGKHNDSSALILLGIALAVAQGAALWWRRSHPELVMAVTLAGGLGILLLAPEVVLPVAGLFAIGSLAAAPAASVARRPRGAHRPGGVQLLHHHRRGHRFHDGPGGGGLGAGRGGTQPPRGHRGGSPPRGGRREGAHRPRAA